MPPRRGESRRQNVGIWAEMEVFARRRTTENRPEQENRGAPGLDRTADTRFRNHAAGVMSGSAACAKVLHSPRFWAGSVVGYPQACRAVVRRLGGITSAVGRLTESRMWRKVAGALWSGLRTDTRP